jgi:glycine/D-amino acid oxidase-like deaminating enzyme
MARTADAAVIGAGIVGASVALALAEAGARTVLVERRRIASGATGASFAWINATAKTQAAAYHRLNAAGVAAWGRLGERFGAESLGLRGGGSVHWAESGEDRDALHAQAERLESLGYPLVRLDARGLRGLEPAVRFGDAAQGFHATADGWVDGPRAVRCLVDAFKEAGGEILEGTDVTGFAVSDRRLTGVDTSAGAIEAPAAVVAAGTHASALAVKAGGPPLPVLDKPGLLVETPEVARAPTRVLYAPAAGGFHMRPTAAGGLNVGADDIDASVAAGAEAASGIAPLLRRAARLLPGLEVDALVARSRAVIGVRPMPGDGVTIAGPLPGAAGVYVVVTHSGVTLGPHLGKLVAAEIISGRAGDDLAPFRPGRFVQEDGQAT